LRTWPADPAGQAAALAAPRRGPRRDRRPWLRGARDRRGHLVQCGRDRAAIKRLAWRRAARLGHRPGQSADRGERRVRGAGLPGDRAGAGQGQVADHPAGADDLPGRVRLGDQAGGGAIDHPAADDRRDPDRDDDRPPAGAARAAPGRGRDVSAGPDQPGLGAPVLELARLSLSFGGLRALSELDLQIQEREVVSVIGPNGAGKTTVFNVITGVYEPSAGDVRFGAQPGPAQSIAGRPPHVIARLGIARTFQTLRLFMNMSVLENVMAATYGGTKAMPWESVLRLPRARREEREARALAED